MSGIDYSLLFGRPTQTGGQSLGDILGGVQQRQMQQLQYQQAQYQAQRQRSLADLVSQNAGVYQNPMAQAFARGGYGDQAAQAEQAAMDRQKTAQVLEQYQRSRAYSMAKQAAEAGDQEAFDRVASAFPSYGLKPGGDMKGQVVAFGKSFITPEQEAENNKGRYKEDAFGRVYDSFTGQIAGDPSYKGRYEMKFNPVTGATYREDKMTGQFIPVSGAAAGGVPASGATSGFNPLSGMKPKDINEQFNKLTDNLSDNNTRKLLGQNAQALQRAEGLEALLHVPDLNTITPQQLREAGTTLNGLIAKGGPQAVSQIEHLTPESLATKFADLRQKILNEPQGADAKAFLENMLDTAAREKKLTLSQMQRIREESLGNYAYLRRANQARYDSILKGAGLNPLSYDDNGRPLTGKAATLAHYRGQLKDGERLVMNAKGQAKAIEAGEPVPAGFEEVK